MKVIHLQEKTEINKYLQRNRALQIYSIGDLDDFFWDYTTWYGLEEDDKIVAIILVFEGLEVPTLLALSDDIKPMRILLEETSLTLPKKMYIHLSPNLIDIIEKRYKCIPYGDHYKMSATCLREINYSACSSVRRLGIAELEEMNQFYNNSYPDNWFDSRMLESGFYYGLWRNNRLVSVAGTHVYSLRFRVAALGNIATHPDYRGKGFGKLVTTKCCRELFKTVDEIGLNVKVDNKAAIKIYRNLGFKVAGVYSEYMVERKRN